jgi:hypothetical protein
MARGFPDRTGVSTFYYVMPDGQGQVQSTWDVSGCLKVGLDWDAATKRPYWGLRKAGSCTCLIDCC